MEVASYGVSVCIPQTSSFIMTLKPHAQLRGVLTVYSFLVSLQEEWFVCASSWHKSRPTFSKNKRQNVSCLA